MRIPKDAIHIQHLRSYGANEELAHPEEGTIAGCPALYKAKYVDFRVKEPKIYAFEYGSVLHDALFLSEEENLPLVPDALEKAWSRTQLPLGGQAWDEAMQDLTKYMERGGDNLATIAVEQKLTAPLMEYKGVSYYYGGTIDRIAIDPNDPMTLYFVDYKSNRAPPSQRMVDADIQFTQYTALVRANIPKYLPDVDPDEVRVIGLMDAVKWYQLYTQREQWQIDQHLDWVRAMTRRIVDDEEGEPVINPTCSWCPIKFDCKEFRKLPGRGETLADRMSVKTDLMQRVYYMQQAELVLRGLDAAVKSVKKELQEEVERKQEPIVINGVEYMTDDAWTTEVDIPALHQILGDDFYNVVSVTAYKIDDIVHQRPELRASVEATRRKYPKGRRLKAVKAQS